MEEYDFWHMNKQWIPCMLFFPLPAQVEPARHKSQAPPGLFTHAIACNDQSSNNNNNSNFKCIEFAHNIVCSQQDAHDYIEPSLYITDNTSFIYLNSKVVIFY